MDMKFNTWIEIYTQKEKKRKEIITIIILVVQEEKQKSILKAKRYVERLCAGFGVI